MEKVLYPGNISGVYKAPPSKSISIRAAAAAIIGDDVSIIRNFSSSKDALASLQIIQKLGAGVERFDNYLRITPAVSKIRETTLNAAESALCLRLFLPFSLLFAGKVTFDAEGSLLKRDVSLPIQTFQKIGINFHSSKFPYIFSGNPAGSNIELDSNATSQWLTGLLYTFSKIRSEHEIVITAPGLTSSHYIDLTLEVLSHAGITIIKDGDKFIIPAHQQTQPLDFTIEGDWSSAAFFIAGAAMTGSLTIKNLNTKSFQPDSIILNVLKYSGCKVEIINNDLFISKPPFNPLSFNVDLEHSPDLFPVLSIYAASCTGTSSLKGIRRLYDKESNRFESICNMLKNFRIKCFTEDDTLFIQGGRIQSAEIDPSNDHRIAMAAAIGAIVASGPVIVTSAGCVSKSYPEFWDNYYSLVEHRL